MRRPSRNIEIFSMSVLDMFASALGAFIMVAIILFPYYQKNRVHKQNLDAAIEELKRTQEEVDKTKAAGEKVQQQIDEVKGEIRKVQLAQVELNQCRQGIQACLVERGKTFLLVKIDWNEPVDVNLYVTDPKGNTFFWAKPNKSGRDFPNSQGRLSTDTAIGEGVEIWQVPGAEAGEYKIEYVLDDASGRATVNGFFFDKSGKKPLPSKVVGDGQARVLGATIEVTAEGRVTMR